MFMLYGLQLRFNVHELSVISLSHCFVSKNPHLCVFGLKTERINKNFWGTLCVDSIIIQKAHNGADSPPSSFQRQH